MDDPVSKVRADFDQLARFDTGAWDHNSQYHNYLLRRLPEHCERALEVGCGTGELTRQLARRSLIVDALDLSPQMIRLAQARSGGCDNIRYQVADVMAVDLPAGEYDAIVSVATLHHLPLEEALIRLRDALRPGGRLLILDLCESAGCRERLLDVAAMPVNVALELVHNGRLREPAEVRAAWAEHGRHERYMRVAEVAGVCERLLSGATVRRHLLWRYSLVWEKSSRCGRQRHALRGNQPSVVDPSRLLHTWELVDLDT